MPKDNPSNHGNRNSSSGESNGDKDASKPTHAQSVRQLLLDNQHGVLSTHSLKHDGFPYASVMPYAISNSGAPLFLISSMATHTKNVKANSKASLLVHTPSNDPLANARATLIGNVERLSDSTAESIQNTYLKVHPKAEQWVGFGDFGFYELQVLDVYIVAGFGSMGWVKKADYFSEFETE